MRKYTLIGRKEILELASEVSPLPYGAYIQEDGTEVLFNRAYQPIIQRGPDRKNIRKASGWITHIGQVWFYDDYFTGKARKLLSENILEAFKAGLELAPFVINTTQNMENKYHVIKH